MLQTPKIVPNENYSFTNPFDPIVHNLHSFLYFLIKN